MASLRVIRAGLHTTVQDLGRWGWQAQGVPVAGAMDLPACRIANALVGNAPSAAVLEITLAGPELEFDDARLVAVAGASFELTLDRSPVAMNAPVAVPAGATLAFGARLEGARAYLAVAGGLAVPEVFGSRSTHVGCRMGGIDGRAIRPGDEIPLGPGEQPIPNAGTRPAMRVAARRMADVRVLAGPHESRFHEDALAALQSGSYAIGLDSDRTGYRLSGPPIPHLHDQEMISDATVVGALQVPPSRQPVLLMADRPTTGGYPIVATVITADIPAVAQLAPGDSLRFVCCSRREAGDAAREAERRLALFEART